MTHPNLGKGNKNIATTLCPMRKKKNPHIIKPINKFFLVKYIKWFQGFYAIDFRAQKRNKTTKRNKKTNTRNLYTKWTITQYSKLASSHKDRSKEGRSKNHNDKQKIS